MNIRFLISGLFFLLPVQASALSLVFPAQATPTAQRAEKSDSTLIPVGPWTNGRLETIKAEGNINKQAWKLPQSGLTTLQILTPLKQQLTDAGFEPLFECATEECGGFDFRYHIDVLPEPDMHVDLGDFRFFSAKRTEQDSGKTEYIDLLVSRSNQAGFVQMIHVAPGDSGNIALVGSSNTDGENAAPNPATSSFPVEGVTDLGAELERNGSVVLEDLTFETGSSTLSDEHFASLEALATYLKTHPDKKITLVGHTDTEGSLAGNIALSKKRAAAVARVLISDYGAPRDQIKAEGMGYLSPRASNLTKQGRKLNRRVEAILTSTQ